MQLVLALFPKFSAHLLIRVSDMIIDTVLRLRATEPRSRLSIPGMDKRLFSQKVRLALGPLTLVSTCTGYLDPGKSDRCLKLTTCPR